MPVNDQESKMRNESDKRDQRTQEVVKDQEPIHERQRKKNSDKSDQRTQK